MNPNNPNRDANHDSTPPGPRRMRKHYVPFGEVEADMVLGEPISLTERGVLRFSLPAGHALTEGNLRQLAAHHAEFVCILVPDTRSDEEIAAESAAAAARVMEIFSRANLANPAVAALFDRVLAYTLTTKATDNNGGVTTSGAIAISVDVPPSVTLTAPAANAVFQAAGNIALAATAADSDGTVTKVDFYQGSTLLGTATAAPYAFTWTNVPAGSYTLTAKATDNKGVPTTSTPVSIKVNAAPTVSIANPTANSVVTAPGNIAITANAADSDGTIQKVDFYQGATLLGTATSAPYTFNWTNVPAGSYTLTAKATDNDGGTAISAAVLLTLDAPPAITLTSPSDGQHFTASASITLTANASDADGNVTKVDFYQGSTLLGTATAAPYTYTWANVGQGSYVLSAKATDNAGVESWSGTVNVIVDAAGARLYYLHTDHLDTPRVVTDETNKVIWRNLPLNEPFGNAPPEEDPDGDGQKFSLNFRFPGQYFDRETNTHYNYYRDYDPNTGRYIQSDPIGLQGGINTYSYALGNPLRYSDPSGLEVTMTCRPVTLFGQLGMSMPVHCAVVVWHWEKDACGNKVKVIDAQYSLAGGGTSPLPQGSNNPTFVNDGKAFQNPGPGDGNYPVPVPPGMTQAQFDQAVQNAGNNYSQGSYFPFGRNSNSAANNIIENAGGTPPNISGAIGQSWGNNPNAGSVGFPGP